MSPELERFASFYSEFGGENTAKLDELYDQNSVFRDPVHEIFGVDALSEYFRGLSAQLQHCRFEFHSHFQVGNKAFLSWTMHYSHKRLGGGKNLRLEGATEVHFSHGKVQLHADYYDMGAMLYEHLPLIGPVVKGLKSRLV